VSITEDFDLMRDKTKVLENRLRRTLARRGYQLMKSRARDPHALSYGGYQIVEPTSNVLVAGDTGSKRGYGLTLEEVAEWTKENTE
jgi:hypothetical protein